MTLQISLNENENAIIQKYANDNKISLPELFIQAVLEKIEDEEEAERLYNEAMEDYEKNPVTYTQSEVGKMLGLTK